jgi:hypothetical protein
MGNTSLMARVRVFIFSRQINKTQEPVLVMLLVLKYGRLSLQKMHNCQMQAVEWMPLYLA